MAMDFDSDRPHQGLNPDLVDRAAPAPVDPRAWLDMLRRRWWVVLVPGLLGLLLVLWRQQGQVPQYTAEVLIQRETEQNGLQGLGLGAAAGAASEGLAAQVELITSHALLRSVVDEVGLRLAIDEADAARGRVVEKVEVASNAPVGSYLLAPSESGPKLLHAESQRELAAADAEGWIAGPGFRLRVAADQLVDPVSLSVLYPEAAVERLRSGLKVERVREASLIRIRFTSAEPELSATVVNTLGQAYQVQAADHQRDAARRRREFLADQIARMSDSVSAAQNALQDFQVQARAIDPAAAGESLSQEYESASNEIRTMRFQEGILQSLVASLRSGQSDDSFQRLLVVGRDLVIGGEGMSSRLTDLENERRKLTASRFGYTSAGPNVEVLDSLIADAKKDYRVLAEQSLRMVQDRRQRGEARVAELRQALGDIPSQSTAVARLSKRAGAAEEVFNDLVSKHYEAQIAEAVAGGKYEVFQPAPVPIRPDPSHPTRERGIALLIGLLFGVGIVFGVEYVNMRVYSGTELERLSGLPVLGMVPRFKSAGRGEGEVVAPALRPGAEAEAFRTIRTAIRFKSPGESSLVLAVTSSAPGEGKSTTSMNLAFAFAQQGARVLVIDADLRRPTLHAHLKAAPEVGLTEVLTRTVAPQAALHSVWKDPDGEGELHLLPAGKATSHASELLSGKELPELLRSARSRFSVIIVDTPPVLAVTDSTVISSFVDGVLFVAAYDRTDRFAFTQALEQLRRAKARLFGLVLNRVPTGRGGYYSGYYSYSEYYHTDGDDRKRIRFRGIRGRSMSRAG